MGEIIWPANPTCHGDNPRFTLGPVTWRQPRDRDDSPYAETFRTCSYCGSIHPEDLMAVISQGATLGGSDWKYGWPHKYYVEGIPNPKAGQPHKSYVSCRSPPQSEIDAGDWERYQDGFDSRTGEPQHVYRKVYSNRPAPATSHAKWYNEHLLDLTPEAFAVVAPVLLAKAGIQFSIEDGKLKYAAPHRGYQA